MPEDASVASPNFLIIGAEKAGTTFLHQAIAAHPDAFMPAHEVPFFEDPDYLAPNGLTNFRKVFEPGAGKRAIGLKRPNYLHRAECAARIHKHCRDAKLIVMLRDPVERAISDYYHYVLNRFLPLRHADRGIPAILAGGYARRYPRSQEVLEGGYYHRHLTRYLALFPRPQVLVVLFDDLCSNGAAVQRRVCEFLDLDPDRAPPPPAGRVNAGVYSLGRLALLRQRSRLMFRYDRNRTRLWSKETVSAAARWSLRSIVRIDARLEHIQAVNDREPVSEETKRRLAEHYIDDTLSLERLLGLDLSQWPTRRALLRSDSKQSGAFPTKPVGCNAHG